MSIKTRTRNTKVALSVRVSPLAQKLVKLEARETNESEGEVVDRCLLQVLLRQPGARQLAREYILQDPELAALFDAAAPYGRPTAR